MSEKRNKRVLQWNVTVVCWTDFTEKLVRDIMAATFEAFSRFLKQKGYSKTTFTIEELSTPTPLSNTDGSL